MSSILMRASAMPNSYSAPAIAGSTILMNRSEPACVVPVLLDRSGRAQNIVGRHAPPFPRKFVAATRAADAFEYAVAHQCLQNRFEMARRQAVARRERFR